jgi:uncharacterized phage-associated protein
MASARDVAAFLIAESGGMTGYQLQKLLYYAQAWHVAWTGAPLFGEQIEAWPKGPVVPDVFREYSRQYTITTATSGEASKLNALEERAVREVLRAYAPFTPGQLVELSHRERPWRDARHGLSAEAPSNAPISVESLRAYFVSREPMRILPEQERGFRVLLALPEDEASVVDDSEYVDADEHLKWLETGDGTPWPSDWSN